MDLPTLNRILDPIRNRVRLLVGRALVRSTRTEGSGQFSITLDLGAKELRDGLELVQQYGVSSRPTRGAQAVALFAAGARDAGVVIATKGMEPDMQFPLEEGEIALHTAEGVSIHLKAGGKIEIHAPTDVRIVSPQVVMSGKLYVAGNVQSGGEVFDSQGPVSSLRTAHDTHTHVGATWIAAPTVVDPRLPPPPPAP